MDTSLEEAVRFISTELKDNPGTDKLKLIEIASQRFDLNPLQTEFLVNKFILDPQPHSPLSFRKQIRMLPDECVYLFVSVLYICSILFCLFLPSEISSN